MIVSTRQAYIIVRAHGSEISRIAQPIKTELLVVFLLIVDELGNRGNKRDKSLPKARTIILIDKERGHRSTIHLTHFAPNPEWVYLFVSFATQCGQQHLKHTPSSTVKEHLSSARFTQHALLNHYKELTLGRRLI